MINEEKFKEKIAMLSDPYYDREFFTHLIYCIDRGQTVRTIFEAMTAQISASPTFSEDLDKSLLQLFYAFQCSSLLRENYQWLPMAQALYAVSLNHGDGKAPLGFRELNDVGPSATNLADFTEAIRRETRNVVSPEASWGGLLFLLENRTTRAQAVGALLGYAVLNSDALSLELLTKGVEVSVACGWKANSIILRRPFARFWANPKPLQVVAQGWRLSKALTSSPSGSGEIHWSPEWSEEFWNRLTQQSVESAWEHVDRLMSKGASIDQMFTLFALLRGRCLFSMKSEQWARVTASLLYGDALQTAARWCPDLRVPILATSLCELSRIAQMIGTAVPLRPTGAHVLDGVSKNISKDRLILRLDDLVERGERHEALEVMAVILKDQGLSQVLCDRLVLMAAKQDAWTFDQKTLPVAHLLTRAFDQALRLGMSGGLLVDAIYGLLRLLSDERDLALEVVDRTGTYGNSLPRSQYDVSGGARIVDRFVFNQMRNAQRVKIWPSDQ